MISPNNRGWILEAVCREIAQHFSGTYTMHYGLTPLPRARTYFFSHWSLFLRCRKQDRSLDDARTLVFFTHPPEFGRLRMMHLARSLGRASMVVSMSSLHARGLVGYGLPKGKVEVILPGTDPALFPGHRRSHGAVGLVSAFYPRKSPERILDIVRSLPEHRFLLLGRDWSKAPLYSQFERLENFTYVESPYADYPGYYAQMDVFLSPSRLEGGPIPLLEAMMSNAVPVATRTGFAPDLIHHGSNGFLYETDAAVDVTCEFVEQAFALDADVRGTVEHLTWERFSRAVQALV